MRQRRLEIVSQCFPYLVAEHAGDVVGYAYASPYRPRPAHRYTAENPASRSGRISAIPMMPPTIRRS